MTTVRICRKTFDRVRKGSAITGSSSAPGSSIEIWIVAHKHVVTTPDGDRYLSIETMGGRRFAVFADGYAPGFYDNALYIDTTNEKIDWRKV